MKKYIISEKDYELLSKEDKILFEKKIFNREKSITNQFYSINFWLEGLPRGIHFLDEYEIKIEYHLI